MLSSPKKHLSKVGWYEWVSLPTLRIPPLLAKIDTGAKTSALHAFRVDLFKNQGIQKVSFSLHPYTHSTAAIHCEANLYDCRTVMDSGGHAEERYVIKTPITLGDQTWLIEITLTNRDTMSFRMLLGRSALRHRFLIDPAKKCLKGSIQRAKDAS